MKLTKIGTLLFLTHKCGYRYVVLLQNTRLGLIQHYKINRKKSRTGVDCTSVNHDDAIYEYIVSIKETKT